MKPSFPKKKSGYLVDESQAAEANKGQRESKGYTRILEDGKRGCLSGRDECCVVEGTQRQLAKLF